MGEGGEWICASMAIELLRATPSAGSHSAGLVERVSARRPSSGESVVSLDPGPERGRGREGRRRGREGKRGRKEERGEGIRGGEREGRKGCTCM